MRERWRCVPAVAAESHAKAGRGRARVPCVGALPTCPRARPRCSSTVAARLRPTCMRCLLAHARVIVGSHTALAFGRRAAHTKHHPPPATHGPPHATHLTPPATPHRHPAPLAPQAELPHFVLALLPRLRDMDKAGKAKTARYLMYYAILLRWARLGSHIRYPVRGQTPDARPAGDGDEPHPPR